MRAQTQDTTQARARAHTHNTSTYTHIHMHIRTKGYFAIDGAELFLKLFLFLNLFFLFTLQKERARSCRTEEGANKYYKNITVCKDLLNRLKLL